MIDQPKTEAIHIADTRATLLDAALMHVIFDGWSDATFDAAVADSGLDPTLAAQACPRKGLDLAVAFHKAGDAAMVAALQAANLSALRYSERVAFGVRARLESSDREAVRRGAALFALPQHAAEGSTLIWGTVSQIWDTLGDTSTDLNWYTKRATLSGVYSATILFWLGDDSEGFENTWAFLERRINNVMQIEMVKAKIKENPMAKAFMAGPGRLFDIIKAPQKKPPTDLPGYIAPKG